jgi:IS4 transposase
VPTARQVAAVYRLRWQIELMFKEWKYYANLHYFTSAKAPLN